MIPSEKLIIGSDHGGFDLKEHLRSYLTHEGYAIDDAGTYGPDSVDYPVYAKKVTQAILAGKATRGILICGTGLGMCYAANRNRGIRAALCTSDELARLSSAHNNANILCLGGRTTTNEDAERFVKIWLSTAYEGGRHNQRIAMLDQ